MRRAIAWGVAVGVVQAASPLAFWWLHPATVYALGLAMIAAECRNIETNLGGPYRFCPLSRAQNGKS